VQGVAGAVDKGGVVGHGLLRRTDRLEYLILHLNHTLGLFQNFRRLSGHNADGVAQVVGHTAHRNHGIPIFYQVAHLILAGDIRRREHARHARQGQGLAGVNGPDNRPRVGGADSGGVEHSLHIHVVGIQPRPLDLLCRIHPVDLGPQLPLPLARILR